VRRETQFPSRHRKRPESNCSKFGKKSGIPPGFFPFYAMPRDFDAQIACRPIFRL
jgi:hypothetical protein